MTDSDPTNPEMRSRILAHLTAQHWLFDREGPRPRRASWPGATALANAIPAESTNVAFITGPVADPPRLIGDAQQFFRTTGIWRLSGPSEWCEALGPVALASGLRAGPPVPLLVLNPIPPSPPAPPGLSVRLVTQEKELRDFHVAAGRGFKIPIWVLRLAMPHIPTGANDGTPTIRLFVGYVDGKPVATSAGVTAAGIVGVSLVASVPEARRRGYGTALTWAAVAQGRTEGASVSYLHATAMGRPVYETMGYRWGEDYHEWLAVVSVWGQLRALFRLLSLAARTKRGARHDPPRRQ